MSAQLFTNHRLQLGDSLFRKYFDICIFEIVLIRSGVLN